MTANQCEIIKTCLNYEPTGTEYIEENCWDWAVQRAEKTILLLKDVLDNNAGNHLTEDGYNEIFDRLCQDYYVDVYTPEEFYDVDN